jgi:hypothetical protein
VSRAWCAWLQLQVGGPSQQSGLVILLYEPLLPVLIFIMLWPLQLMLSTLLLLPPAPALSPSWPAHQGVALAIAAMQ